MADLRLIHATPDSCYLHGSTGPLAAAKKLWKDRTDNELEDLAAQLAKQLELSPQVVEDALCNWEK